MFKRVTKRFKKIEKEEAMGLDSEMKEMLGMNESDSDESDTSASSSDEKGENVDESDMTDGGSSEDENDGLGKRKRHLEDEGDAEDEDEDEVEDGDDEDEEEGDAYSDIDGELSDETPMSLEEAVNNPLYVTSAEPEIWACLVCPGKLLKNVPMIDSHKNSNAHKRRFRRFVNLAAKADPESDPRRLVTSPTLNKFLQERMPLNGLSKRAQKRQAKQAAIKARREKQKSMKAKAIAKKAAEKAAKAGDQGVQNASEIVAPKKRKIDDELANVPGQITSAKPITSKRGKHDKKSRPTSDQTASAASRSASSGVARDAPPPAKDAKAVSPKKGGSKKGKTARRESTK